MPLDPAKLVNVRTAAGKTTAQCPVCASNGKDQKARNHLVVFADGKFGCCVDNSPEHYRQIWLLAGDGNSGEHATQEQAPEPKVELDRTWPESSLAGLLLDHSYWEGRGVPASVLEPLRGGVATKGQMGGRYVLPVFGDDGLIHGFTGRSLHGMMPKWKHVGRVSAWLWGDLEGIETGRRAILVEGPGDRLALDARGVRGALVLWGVNLSQTLLAHLISVNPTEIVICTNNDRKEHMAGQRAAERIQRILCRFFDGEKIRTVLPGEKDLLDQHVAGDAAWAEWLARLDPEAPVDTPSTPTEDEPYDSNILIDLMSDLPEETGYDKKVA